MSRLEPGQKFYVFFFLTHDNKYICFVCQQLVNLMFHLTYGMTCKTLTIHFLLFWGAPAVLIWLLLMAPDTEKKTPKYT